MTIALNRLRNVVCICGILPIVMHGESPQRPLPKLGDKVPAYVLISQVQNHQCLTDTRHYDPCAAIKIHKKAFTIAWDAHSKEVTYIFSNDPNLEDDSELGVGGSCRLVDESGHPDPIVPYMHWLISPVLNAMFEDLSGYTLWFVVLRRQTDFPDRGEIVGFLQSRYVKVPEADWLRPKWDSRYAKPH